MCFMQILTKTAINSIKQSPDHDFKQGPSKTGVPPTPTRRMVTAKVRVIEIRKKDKVYQLPHPANL